MIVREIFSQEPIDIPEMFGKFLPIAMKVLKISKLPKIQLEAHIEDDEQPTFGRYVNDEVAIHLALSDRHPVDILRTLAHELVHFKQHTEGRLGPNSGETGSPEENQAHEVAGVIMRHFNKMYPIYLKSKPLVFEHNKKINERRRKKIKKAAYGPGLYGGYGYYAGYSGDSSGGDSGGVAEGDLIPWPKGTVKVDVSDVYDWYKLGQHISNLKGLGKHDFGKGPPQTVISFGSEPLEHKYLKYLKQLGLDTHDIDENFADGKNLHEKVQDYLWHGSKSENDILYPQQANDTGGKEQSNKNAVYATPNAKVAIAMGLTTPGSDTGMFPNDPQMVLFKGNIRKGEYVYLHKVPKDLFIKHNSREWYSKPGVNEVKPIEIVKVPVDKYLNLIRQATPRDLELQKKYMKENFADGRNPQDKGDAKRHGVPTKASVSTLRKVAKQGGRKGQLAHWMANMKAGRKK